MVNKDKKFLINEGRAITNGKFAYGGFPRVINEAEAATKAFQDSPEQGQKNVATKPNSEEETITWTAEAGGSRLPSESYKKAYLAYREAGKNIGAAHEAARTQYGPNYMERTKFMQQPAVIELKKKLDASEETLKAHPHYAEHQLGHPETRMAKLTPEEASRHETESMYGTSYHLDPTTKKPIYGKRPIGGLGT
jgi:hypothetical protein